MAIQPSSSSSSPEKPESRDDMSQFQDHSPPAPPPVTSSPVPRAQRRGLLAQLTVVAEVEDSKSFPRRTKWFITALASAAASAAPLGSTIFFPALSNVASSLHTTSTITTLAIALYMLAMSLFPLWWSSLSEVFGRRTIYLISFSMFIVFSLLSALSRNIAMLIPMRLMSGGASASVQAIGAGTIADVWEVKERGMAMGCFYLGPLCGPLIAPILGGAVAGKWGWRSTQWLQMIYGSLILLALLFGLPETLQRRATDGDERPKKSIMRWVFDIFVSPLHILRYLGHFPVLVTVLYSSIMFGTLYVLNVSIANTFNIDPYNFSTVILGLLYIPNSLGYLVTSFLGGRWMDYIMQREAKRANRYNEEGGLIFRPYDRMRENAWIGVLIFPGALLWYGWTVQKGVFWFVPILSNFFFGAGSMMVFGITTTMLTEFMPQESSAGVALNNFVRNLLSCAGAVATVPLIRGPLGNGWLFTILAIVCWGAGVFTVIWMRRCAIKEDNRRTLNEQQQQQQQEEEETDGRKSPSCEDEKCEETPERQSS